MDENMSTTTAITTTDAKPLPNNNNDNNNDNNNISPNIKKDRVAYFNNAGKTALPPTVKQAGIESLDHEAHPHSIPPPASTATQIRKQFSKLINANPTGEDIAIVPSTSFALTLAANNLYRTGAVKNKNRILVLQDEMSSQVYCWQEICHLSGAALDVIPHPTNDGGWTEMIVQRLESNKSKKKEEQDRIAVVCLPQVHWSDGSYINLAQIGQMCHEQSIVFVVDATQSVGIHPLNIQEIKCHVLAASVHKWLLGPHGTSLLYIHSSYHDTWLPLDQHERSRIVFQNPIYNAGVDAIEEEKGGYPEEFIKGAARCDSGGKKNPILLPMVLEGLSLVNSLDLQQSQSLLKEMTNEILTRVQHLGLRIQNGPRAGHILGLRPDDSMKDVLTPATMVQIVENLKQKKIFLAVRCGAFRIAPYLDTTKEEVDMLVDGLEGEIQKMVEDKNMERDGDSEGADGVNNQGMMEAKEEGWVIVS